MSIPVLPDPYYENTLEFYVGSHNLASENALFSRYLETRGYDYQHIPKPTDEIKNDFRSFVSFYTSMGISAVTDGQNIPTSPDIEDDFYKVYLKAFYGNLPDDVQKDIWNTFLLSHNYTTNPPDSSSVRELFANYIKGLQAQAKIFETATSITPQEELHRAAVYDVLGALTKYLKSTQDLIANQGALLLLYANWQQEYTKMMQKIPTLQSGTPGSLTTGGLVSAQDYTFGYGNINLQDVVNWAYAQACLKPGSPVTFGDATSGMGAYTFQVNNIDVDHTTCTITFTAPQINSGVPIRTDIDIKNMDHLNSEGKIDPINMSISEANTAIGNGFISMLQGVPDFTTIMSKPYAPDVANWMIQQATQNLPSDPESPWMVGLTPPFYPKYYGATISYNNKNIESDPAKQFSIDIAQTSTGYLRYAGSILITQRRYYVCTLTCTYGNNPPSTVKYVTIPDPERAPNGNILAYIRPEDRPEYDFQITQGNMTDAIENTRWAIYNFLEANALPVGPIALPGYNLGTVGTDPGYDVTTPDFWKNLVGIPLNVAAHITPSITLEQKESQARGDTQAVLTQYSQTIQGVRDLIGSLASRQLTALNQAKDSLNTQADIFTTILESIDSIMKAICKK